MIAKIFNLLERIANQSDIQDIELRLSKLKQIIHEREYNEHVEHAFEIQPARPEQSASKRPASIVTEIYL
jgi:hypothetical protein